MSWAKLDDGFYDHPKVVAAGLAATGLFVRALAYSTAKHTDGYVSTPVVAMLSGGELALATRLVEVGLWEQADDGYRIHDFFDYNPSGKQVKRQRVREAERLRAYRRCNRERTGVRTSPDTATVHAAYDGPVPDPVPGDPPPQSATQTAPPPSSAALRLEPQRAMAAKPPRYAARQGDPEGFAAFWRDYPRHDGRQAAVQAWRKLRPDDELRQTIHAALAWQRHREQWQDPEKIPHASTWLTGRRWEDEPPRQRDATISRELRESLSAFEGFLRRQRERAEAERAGPPALAFEHRVGPPKLEERRP